MVQRAVAVIIYYFYGQTPYVLRLRPDWSLCGTLIQESWPLLITSFFLTAQIHIGRLIVGDLFTKAEGGYYAVAIKLAASVQFLPTVYFASVYPLLSRYHSEDTLKFRWLYRLSYKKPHDLYFARSSVGLSHKWYISDFFMLALNFWRRLLYSPGLFGCRFFNMLVLYSIILCWLPTNNGFFPKYQ